MLPMSESKKTLRHFYCLDRLWEALEGLAGGTGCSIDALLNDAMRLYLKSRGHATPSAPQPRPPTPPRQRIAPRPPPPLPQPRQPTGRPGSRPSIPALVLIFNNQRILIEQDQFIIGRSTKTSNLAIKDGNISRKHAAIIRRQGAYYIKDLGSTNGVDFRGMRIDNKRIDEGDAFHICDYELRFTYRPA